MESIVTRYPIIHCWVDFFATELSVTPERLVGKRGLLNVRRIDFPIEQVTSVEIESSIWGQMVKYSDIVIKTASSVEKFRLIGNAAEFQRYCIDVLKIKEDKKAQKQADAIKEAFTAAMQANSANQSQPNPQMTAPSASDSASKFCSSCGNKLAPGSAFCNSCGAKVE